MQDCLIEGLNQKVAALQKSFYTLANNFNNLVISVLTQTFLAGVTINGGMAVMVDVDKRIYPFDITNPYHYDKYAGIAQTSASPMEPCVVVIEGVSKLIGSGWSAGVAYFIGTNSFLTSIEPSEGTLLKRVGVGIDINTILINEDFQIITS